MALAYHNATLEYATNTLEFWLYDDAGGAVEWTAGTTFNIERIDNNTLNYSVIGTIDPVDTNKITFVVTPPITLKDSADTLYDYYDPTYDHIYSVTSPGNTVYLAGKINLVEVAG